MHPPAMLASMRIRRLGIVADTHGEMRTDAVSTLRSSGVDLILHAGDIGSELVLAALEQVAPVIAVAGNGDPGFFHRYPWDLRLWLGQRRIFLCHWYDNYGRVHPGYQRTVDEWAPDVLVYGHTHQALIEQRGTTLFFNPGYAGPPEPSRTRSVGTLDLTTLDARIHYL
jgi:uncharacterized protein